LPRPVTGFCTGSGGAKSASRVFGRDSQTTAKRKKARDRKVAGLETEK
jgi:hypothetical protein